MLIMQKDLLAEFCFPDLDLKSTQNVMTQNSARLPYLKEGSNDVLNKRKTKSFNSKVVVDSVVSDLTTNKTPWSTSNENLKTSYQKFILKKSLTSSEGDTFINGVSAHCHAITGKSTVASNEVQKRLIDNVENKCVESRQSSQNCVSEIPFPQNNTFLISQLNNCCENEPLKNEIDSSPFKKKREVKLLLDSSFKESLGCARAPLPVNSCSYSLNTKAIIKQPEARSDFDKDFEPAFCVISEVVGNASAIFRRADDTVEKPKEIPEVQLITPKKTNDITKIKGWRRKQFFVEKPTTIEFYSLAKGSITLKRKFNLSDDKINSQEPGNLKNAFVCKSLDDFLDREAELKIGYEIPHLYAEFGIKLTRDEVVSRPNLSEKDIKEMETRYCVPVSMPCESINLDDIKEENTRGIKRTSGDDITLCKMLKLDENKNQSERLIEQQENQLKIESEAYFSEPKSSSCEFNRNDSNLKVLKPLVKGFSHIKLVNKLVALVVYPGPFVSLHPLVQYHLDKIRSYRTKVDRNWANFAASAVLVNEKQYKRSVLPVYCCAKIEMNLVENNNSNNKDEESIQKTVDCVSTFSKLEDFVNIKNESTKPIQLKKCSVVLEKLGIVDRCAPWCMEHNSYNCVLCGLAKPKYKNLRFRKTLKKLRFRDKELVKSVIVPPRASFDKKIASLLAKKVRLLKANGDTIKSIDYLKTLTSNTVEFIRLKFVKESFLSGYLNLWYLKPEVPTSRSRAFLTFSHISPMPNAINLKSTAFPVGNLPKVITEIVSSENTFDSNEYAILHCDGRIWEIHGSLNMAFRKYNKNVEQVFISAELPELKALQVIAHNILHVKAFKWWILDLTQKFKLMELKSGNVSVIVTKNKFVQTVGYKFFGFLPLRKNSKGRLFGAYIMQRLLPFVLIGPYYLLESSDLVLKDESSSVPFSYNGEENVTTNCPLKYFINTVIRNQRNNEKKLEGLWLYDKMRLDSTSYLEVVTANAEVPRSSKYSCIEIEHGYSLNSLTNSSPTGTNSSIIKSRKDDKEELKKITVYLYFDIFELGFVEGELQFDNSVIISHPLDKRTKMKSHKIGDWFICIIKRRIEFFPKNLGVRWFITKHKDDLRERRPFNRFFLSGAHILTKNGIFYLLEMSDSKIEKLGIDRNEVVKAIAQSEVIREVKELKNLSNLLVDNPKKSLSMHEVLKEAVKEIKKLRKLQKTLRNKKIMAEKEKLNLCSCLIKKLNHCPISFHLKMKVIEKLEPLLKNDNGDLNDFAKKLKVSRIGRKYLKRMDKRVFGSSKVQENNSNKVFCPEKEKLNKSKSAKLQFIFSPIKSSPQEKNSQITVLKGLNICRNTVGVKTPQEHLELQNTEKLSPNSGKFTSFKKLYPKILKKSKFMKKQEENGENGKIKTELMLTKLQNNYLSKRDKFLKIASPELTDNVKQCWKNWNIKKLEVV